MLVLAVDLGVGIARNHGFNDGNKRTGFVAILLFLRFNGYRLEAPDDVSLGRLMEHALLRIVSEETFAERLLPYIRAE